MNRDDIARLIEIAGLRNHEGVQALAAMAAVSRNARWAGLLQRIVEPLAMQAADPQPFPAPDMSAAPTDGIHIGAALMMNGEPLQDILLPLKAFCGDVLVLGGKGFGKSWAIASACEQLMERGAVVIVFDTEAEYAELLARRSDCSQLAVYSSDTLRINFHEPVAGENVEDCVARVQRLFREWWLRDGSTALLGEVLHREYEHGAPSVRSMLSRLEKMRFRVGSRYNDWYESVLLRYKALNAIPMFQCHKGMALDVFLKRSSIIRLHGLSQEQLAFVINALMSCITRVMEKNRNDRLPMVVFVLDEFHRVASRANMNLNDRGELLVIEAARTLRKRGGGLLIGDQVPAMLPPQIIALANTKVVFKLNSGDDVRVIGNSLALDAEQRDFLTQLGNRRAVFYSPAVSLRPFMLSVPELSFEIATHGEIEERMRESTEGLEWVPYEAEHEEKETAGVSEKQEQASRFKGSKRALDYLQDVAQRLFIAAGKRDASLRLSGWMGSQIRKELLDAGLVRFHQMKTGAKGGAFLLVEPTESAYELLGSMDVRVPAQRGKGGFLHRAMQFYVSEYYRVLRPGARVVIEDDTYGKAVDVAVYGDDEKIAVEIFATGVGKEIFGLGADLRNYEKVVIVSNEPDGLRSLKEKVFESFSEDERAVISFQLISDVLSGLERLRKKKE